MYTSLRSSNPQTTVERTFPSLLWCGQVGSSLSPGLLRALHMGAKAWLCLTQPVEQYHSSEAWFSPGWVSPFAFSVIVSTFHTDIWSVLSWSWGLLTRLVVDLTRTERVSFLCYVISLPCYLGSSFLRRRYVGLRGSFSGILTLMPLKFEEGGSLPSREGVHGFCSSHTVRRRALHPERAADNHSDSEEELAAFCPQVSGVWGLFSIGKLRVSFIFFASCISVFVFFLYPR